MVFASLLFVFLFLPLNILSQQIISSARGKNLAMLAFSLVFYAWSGPAYLFLLMIMVFICWIGAKAIQEQENQSDRKAVLAITVGGCLAILGIFKYAGFFVSTVVSVTGASFPIPHILLPIGISFYTFQLISYTVDVYRGQVEAQPKYWMLLLYASLFHQCIAGPIIRYQDIHRDIVRRKTTVRGISRGISRFCIGLAKKAILANGCAVVADHFFAVEAETLAATPILGILLGTFAFALQIYLDFSAYSDMAIGMGMMHGFHYKENFNYPYISQSVTEFWRRWHISLGKFFRDYVYIPMGGNRCSVLKQLRNLLVVWFLTGLWHGANTNFILWGLYFGFFIAVERFIVKDRLSWLPSLVKMPGIFSIVMLSFILFKFEDPLMLQLALKGLLGLNGNGLTNMDTILIWKNHLFFLAVCVLASIPIGTFLHLQIKNLSRRSNLCFLIDSAVEILIPAALLLLASAALAGDSYNPFLYFQF